MLPAAAPWCASRDRHSAPYAGPPLTTATPPHRILETSRRSPARQPDVQCRLLLVVVEQPAQGHTKVVVLLLQPEEPGALALHPQVGVRTLGQLQEEVGMRAL